jgi:transposase
VQVSARAVTVVLDNNSIYIDKVIVSTIEAEGYIVYFLSPYSPDFNPIELIFSVLKIKL